jgi:transposase
VHFIVNTLGYSRRFHFWCTDCEDAEHTYEGLIRSFEYFGGYMRNRQGFGFLPSLLDHSQLLG